MAEKREEEFGFLSEAMKHPVHSRHAVITSVEYRSCFRMYYHGVISGKKTSFLRLRIGNCDFHLLRVGPAQETP